MLLWFLFPRISSSPGHGVVSPLLGKQRALGRDESGAGDGDFGLSWSWGESLGPSQDVLAATCAPCLSPHVTIYDHWGQV